MSIVDIISKIRKGKIWDFHGGLHPDEHKRESSEAPLVDAGIPPFIVLPIKQHSGRVGRLLVKVGDRVLAGQQLTASDHPMEVPVHASTSGVICSIELHTVAHPSGLSEPCIHIKPDGLDTWRERDPWPDFRQRDAVQLFERIRQAGIAGLGGAGFPTYAKLSVAREKSEIVIINGAECEPYITADDRLMREHAREILEGVEIIKHILRPTVTIIAIEDNKPEAISAFLLNPLPDDVIVRVIPTKYPSGSARQLIEILTGKQVPAGGRSLSLGIVMVNVGTTYAIRQAIVEDEPLIRRVVTLTGSQFKHPGNAWVRLGSSVRWLLAQFSLIPEPRQRVIMGGSMMGFTLPHADVPVVKITNCLLAPSVAELPPRDDEMNCIRCSKCAEVCPVKLLPQQLYWYSKAGDHENAEKYNLADCIECGACAWVCPSNIPLVHYYRQEKAEIQHLREEAAQADRAKLRFEAKKQRLEEERRARESVVPPVAHRAVGQSADSDPVAAAIMRIKAQQAQTVPGTTDIRAEREARKAQAIRHQAEKAQSAEQAASPAGTTDDARKAAVAAALARAKARKAEIVASDVASSAPATSTTEDPDAAKKAAVAAAIARAKAKKAQTEQQPANEADKPQQAASENDPDAVRKAAVAAAIARAKAKKAQAEQQPANEADKPQQAASETDPDAAKKAAVAAAIARVKAKKAQAEAEAAQNKEPQE
ncbi:electron transport complex subunit RsxC [Tolumonas osonensis]|uniref:Ion-translocating oxidoreductase complex subunit C n=1 Tax=Tolumonas osonensis TaxID=675874 RepID=A0A841GKF1_9GAMM|nr:electron transport complex subunit RsxC [Tolumonas osonensis]MBB6055671.1 electron transport complex protein RnfC [Tolumonas osonensis]